MLRQIVAIMLVSFGASLLDLGFLRRYSKPLHNFQTITSARSAQSVRNMKLYQENSWQSREGSPRSEIPTRYDTCLVIADGIIGMEPKDMYLKNGHHVVNFPLAFIGHFRAAHEWERFKPTETMWVSCEIWDDMASKYKASIYKGSQIKCVGYLISNKWTDKSTGEEKKQFRYRVTKLLSEKDFYDVANILEVDERSTGIVEDSIAFDDISRSRGDSNFSSEFPNDSSQLQNPDTKSISRSNNESKSTITKSANERSSSNSSGNNNVKGQSPSRSWTSSAVQKYPTWGDDGNSNQEVQTSDFWQ